MRRLIILTDMDDVLNNLLEKWVELVNTMCGTATKPEEITSWDVSVGFPTLTREQVYSVLSKNFLWNCLSPTKDSVEVIKKLIGDGHRIVVVTASDYQVLPAKIAWLLEAYPYLTWQDIIITQDKRLILGDVLIDDGIHNLEGGQYKKILFSRPHNLSYDAEKHGMTRVSSWNEIYDAINKIQCGDDDSLSKE